MDRRSTRQGAVDKGRRLSTEGGESAGKTPIDVRLDITIGMLHGDRMKDAVSALTIRATPPSRRMLAGIRSIVSLAMSSAPQPSRCVQIRLRQRSSRNFAFGHLSMGTELKVKRAADASPPSATGPLDHTSILRNVAQPAINVARGSHRNRCQNSPRAITAQAPASSAILACSTFMTSMMTLVLAVSFNAGEGRWLSPAQEQLGYSTPSDVDRMGG